MNATSGSIATTSGNSQEFIELLRDAAEWRLLGLFFARPSDGWATQIEWLAKEIHDEELRKAAEAAKNGVTASLYDTAFGPGGPAVPREISHRPQAISGQYLAELVGFYQAFGYHSPYVEPPDHVAVEIDFVSYLRLKEAYAIARDDVANAKVTAIAAKSFLQQHLSVIAAAISETMQNCEIPYLKMAATALNRRVSTLSPAFEPPQQAWGTASPSHLPIICRLGCYDDSILE